MASRNVVDARIADNGTLSTAIEIPPNQYLAALVVPAGWVAADISFQGSHDGTTFYDVYDEFDAEVVVQAAASRYIVLEPARFLCFGWIKVRSGTTGTPVSQTGGPLVLEAILI